MENVRQDSHMEIERIYLNTSEIMDINELIFAKDISAHSYEIIEQLVGEYLCENTEYFIEKSIIES